MDNAALASELRRIITTRHENKGTVKTIADALGLAEVTIYDYLHGRIKISLDFIKAAAAATNDPDIKKHLEPEGMTLVKNPDIKQTSGSILKELNDVYMAAAAIQETIQSAIEDGRITSGELSKIERTHENLHLQSSEVLSIIRNARETNEKIRVA